MDIINLIDENNIYYCNEQNQIETNFFLFLFPYSGSKNKLSWATGMPICIFSTLDTVATNLQSHKYSCCLHYTQLFEVFYQSPVTCLSPNFNKFRVQVQIQWFSWLFTATIESISSTNHISRLVRSNSFPQVQHSIYKVVVRYLYDLPVVLS